VQQQARQNRFPKVAKMDSATIPALALLHDKSLAKYLYPVSIELATQVAQSCSKVTCASFADLGALLGSPRWRTAKPCTALWIRDSAPIAPAATSGLCVWVKAGAAVDLDALSKLAPQLADLQLLDVAGHIIEGLDLPDSVGREALQELAAVAQHWPRLQHLDLSESGLRHGAVKDLAAAAGQHWRQLTYLDLSSNSLGPADVTELAAAAPNWPQLHHLDLAHTGLGEAAAKELAAAAAPHWQQLTYLDVGLNTFGVKGARAWLSAAHQWQQLQHLGLSNCDMRAIGAQELASAAPQWLQLQHLDISISGLGPEGAKELVAAASHWQQLQSLNLPENRLAFEDLQGLEAVCMAL
jgi:hypothetical protein